MHRPIEKLSVKYEEKPGFPHLSGARYKGGSLIYLWTILFTGD